MNLKENQSALVLEIDDQGEVTVNVASGDHDSPTAQICQIIAGKLMEDEAFQEEVMSKLSESDTE